MLLFSENWSDDAAADAGAGAGGAAAAAAHAHADEPEYFFEGTPPLFWIFSRLRYKLGKNWSS